jgi:hypothetical protein
MSCLFCHWDKLGVLLIMAFIFYFFEMYKIVLGRHTYYQLSSRVVILIFLLSFILSLLFVSFYIKESLKNILNRKELC